MKLLVNSLLRTLVFHHTDEGEYRVQHFVQVLVSLVREIYDESQQRVHRVVLETDLGVTAAYFESPRLLTQVTNQGSFAFMPEDPRDVSIRFTLVVI